MTDPEGNELERVASELDNPGRTAEIVALAAQLFFLAMACGILWFLLRLVLGTSALGTGSHPWIPNAICVLNVLLPTIFIVAAWFVYRRWKTQ